ncbi:UDP-N-acetylglucosamine 2-epimerase [Effusibacillus pohliae]|uniref:UDP-N-acetylglucosamine 2-epimerase n=1 Tax=Effusibacillus pohliae TaxID=232270 RepID=UPI00036BB503|nr:UDP-N-acetylglucosamine 2-epimerase [Effusibacillus pohliae]
MRRRKICVVTGTRADYGLLYWLMKMIQDDAELELQIIVTGMHCSPEFGLTYKIIEEDGFFINEKVEMLLSSDTPVGIAKSIGLGVIGFADALARLRPDFLVLLGDRYEILAAAQAAMVAKIPIAHIAGGDTTEGAYDELIRHSITKMSHLHFVTNDAAAKRVRQLGENPDYIFNVGSPGIDQIKRLKLLTREQLEKELDFKFLSRNLLITFHPATLDSDCPAEQFRELLKALEILGNNVGLIFTKPNSDTGGRSLIRMIDDYVATHSNAKAYTSLGQLRYLSTIAQVDAVVGNSSSGLYEAPSLKTPTVNIGERQKGRLQASSVINCQPKMDEIVQAIRKSFLIDCSNVVNPYGDGESSQKIVTVLKEIQDPEKLLKKHFFEVS